VARDPVIKLNNCRVLCKFHNQLITSAAMVATQGSLAVWILCNWVLSQAPVSELSAASSFPDFVRCNVCLVDVQLEVL